MSNLNAQQKKASEILSGPVLVLAGAGAGKTKTLTERIINLIKNGAEEKSILAVTFTNKAAGEMSDRLSKELGVEAFHPFNPNHPFIGTFHSLGVKIIRENIKLVGLKTKNFDIYDRGDSLRIIKKIIKSEGLNSANFDPGKILSIISKQKGDGLRHSDLLEKANNFFTETLASIWKKYDQYLIAENALDFDDLLGKSLLVLKNHPEVRNHYQDLWQHIHIDEYQDTNKTQYQMSKILAHKHKNIFAVGDVDQNIYSWRGADISNILNFEKDYPEATVVLLEQNYRSTKNIISAANQVIIKNKKRKEKNLFTENHEGEKIGLFGAYDEKDEANFITEKSIEIIDKGTKPDEIAVLYRANFQSRALEEAFMASGLPFQVVGTRFFERKEVKDIIAYLKASLNKDSYHLWERIVNAPPRGIGKVTLAKLYSGMENKTTPAVKEKIDDFKILLEKIAEKANSGKISETILFIVEKTGLKTYLEKEGSDGEERLENIKELAVFASRYDDKPAPINLESFLTDVSLQSDQDSLSSKKTGVKLMTIHASKGLEFDTVFITGLEDKLFPHKSNFNNEKTDPKMEEERRLFYVALTRAKRKVILTYAGVRSIFGQKDVTIPSEFIFEIGDELLENEAIDHGPRETHEKVIYFD